MTKERPILFSAPMVRAILDGRKTMTRRLLDPQPVLDRMRGRETSPKDAGWILNDDSETWRYDAFRNGGQVPQCGPYKCPHGKPGDHLWVRENFYANIATDHLPVYAADEEVYAKNWKKTPSIHMPRRFSRIDLLIKEIRIERLQAITEADAKAEGCTFRPGVTNSYRQAFSLLWGSIHGEGSWTANPWVWVETFTRVKP